MQSASRGSGEATSARAARGSLTRVAVIDAAYALADAEGLDALTMRSVASRLGTKPMSLYRHVANKDELLDALVERVYAQFALPDPQRPEWRAELRRRADSVRQVLVWHPWALSLIETRSAPQRPLTFSHAEAVLATLVKAGCSPRLAAQMFVTLDSYIYGFALQQITMVSTEPEVALSRDVAAAMREYPTMVTVMEVVAADGDYDFVAEFHAGLELVLDGINTRILAEDN